MEEMENQGLSARELFEGVYQFLKDKLDGKEIKLPSKARAEIASDSDWHRTRIGYTGYETALLLKINGNEWAISFGTKCGSYPADPYNCDIAAVPVSTNGKHEEEIAKEVHEALEEGSYFHNSLIYAMANGQLGVNKYGRFGSKVFELLRLRVGEFIAAEMKIDSRYFTMDLRPVVKSSIRYKPEFIPFLFETFRHILAECAE